MRHPRALSIRGAGATALVALAVAGAFLLGRATENVAQTVPAAVAAPPVDVAPRPGRAPSPEFLGVVVARASADIAPRFEGRLEQVLVRLGDRVEAGAILAVLDVPALRHDLRAAEIGLKTVEVEQSLSAVELSEAEERLRRNQALFEKGIATGEEYATARYQQQLNTSRVAQAQARLTEHRTQVDRLRKENEDTLVRAPFAGIVATRYIDPGAIVGSSRPIVRLISARDFLVRFAVPEQQVGAVAVGLRVRLRLGTRDVAISGTIDKISPEIEVASRMLFVEAQLPPDTLTAAAALSGEIAHVSIEGTR